MCSHQHTLLHVREHLEWWAETKKYINLYNLPEVIRQHTNFQFAFFFFFIDRIFPECPNFLGIKKTFWTFIRRLKVLGTDQIPKMPNFFEYQDFSECPKSLVRDWFFFFNLCNLPGQPINFRNYWAEKQFLNCRKNFKHPGKHLSGILKVPNFLGSLEKIPTFPKLPKLFVWFVKPLNMNSWMQG